MTIKVRVTRIWTDTYSVDRIGLVFGVRPIIEQYKLVWNRMYWS